MKETVYHNGLLSKSRFDHALIILYSFTPLIWLKSSVKALRHLLFDLSLSCFSMSLPLRSDDVTAQSSSFTICNLEIA